MKYDTNINWMIKENRAICIHVVLHLQRHHCALFALFNQVRVSRIWLLIFRSNLQYWLNLFCSLREIYLLYATPMYMHCKTEVTWRPSLYFELFHVECTYSIFSSRTQVWEFCSEYSHAISVGHVKFPNHTQEGCILQPLHEYIICYLMIKIRNPPHIIIWT